MINEMALKKSGKLTRLTNRTFQFPEQIRSGFYTANYFLKTQSIIQNLLPRQVVTMQFFQWQPGLVVCGLDEVIALIHTFAHHPEQLLIEALEDGEVVEAKEPVLRITGVYEDFGFLESTIDGILSRRSSVATNAKEVLLAANGKPVFSMPIAKMIITPKVAMVMQVISWGLIVSVQTRKPHGGVVKEWERCPMRSFNCARVI